VLGAAVSGEPRFFLGTDSAPHPKGAKVGFEVACQMLDAICTQFILILRACKQCAGTPRGQMRARFVVCVIAAPLLQELLVPCASSAFLTA